MSYNTEKEFAETEMKIKRLTYYMKSNSYNELTDNLKDITRAKLKCLEGYKDLLEAEIASRKSKVFRENRGI